MSRLLDLDLPNDGGKAENLLAMATESRAWVDGWVAYAVGHRSDIVCAGCRTAHCCQMPVFATVLEAFPIAVTLDDWHLNTKAYRKALRRLGEAQEDAVERETEDQRKHRCPFLSGNRCVVYDLRPTNCRAYFVVGDRTLCVHAKDRPDRHAPIIPIVDKKAPVEVTLLQMADLCKAFGWENSVHLRALPSMVAAWLEVAARQAGGARDSGELWTLLEAETVMPKHRLDILWKRATEADDGHLDGTLIARVSAGRAG